MHDVPKATANPVSTTASVAGIRCCIRDRQQGQKVDSVEYLASQVSGDTDYIFWSIFVTYYGETESIPAVQVEYIVCCYKKTTRQPTC